MIDHAVNLIAQRLNQHLKNKSSSSDGLVSDDLVMVGGFVDGDGQHPESARNRLLLFVTNIAQDSMRRSITKYSTVSATGVTVQPDPVHLNISLMLASNFYAEKYLLGLKMLSDAIGFFQAHSIFTPQNTPEMPEDLGQLTLEISDLSVDNLSHVWGIMGGSYMPSITYLMRTVTIDSAAITRKDQVVREPNTRTKTGAT